MELIGTLTEIGQLKGSLTPIQSLVGNLSDAGAQLTGTLTAIPTLIGELNSNIPQLSCELTTPDVIYADVDSYNGTYVVTPKPYVNQTLETAGLRMHQDVTVKKIPYYQTSNTDGYTVYIGGE